MKQKSDTRACILHGVPSVRNPGGEYGGELKGEEGVRETSTARGLQTGGRRTEGRIERWRRLCYVAESNAHEKHNNCVLQIYINKPCFKKRAEFYSFRFPEIHQIEDKQQNWGPHCKLFLLTA